MSLFVNVGHKVNTRVCHIRVIPVHRSHISVCGPLQQQTFIHPTSLFEVIPPTPLPTLLHCFVFLLEFFLVPR